MSDQPSPDLRKVSRGFQITLPVQFREQHGLQIGDHVRIEQAAEQLIITPLQTRRQQLAEALVTQLAESATDQEPLDDEAALQFAIDQVKHYRKSRKKKSLRA